MAGIDVVVTDKIDQKIKQSIAEIGLAAKLAYGDVAKLQQLLATLRSGSINIKIAAGGVGSIQSAGQSIKQMASSAGVASTAMSGLFQKFIGGNSATSAFTRGIRESTQTIRSFASAYLLFRGLSSGVTSLDAARSTENRLRQASDIRGADGTLDVAGSAKRLQEVLKQTYSLANEARAPVLQVADAFLKIDQAVKKVGLSQADSFKIVGILTKSLSASGFDAGKIGQVLNQLGETFSQGKLNSDEFRRVRETLPGLIDELAKSEGGLGNVIKLAEDQKLTLDKLIPAIFRYGAAVNENFGRAPATVSQGFQILKNQITEFFGTLDKDVNISDTFNAAFRGIAENLPVITKAVGVLGAALIALFAIPAAGWVIALTTNIPAGIAIATAAIILFKDEIVLSSEKGTTLDDVFRGIGKTISEWKVPDSVQAVLDKAGIKNNDSVGEVASGVFGNAKEAILQFEKAKADFWKGAIGGVSTGASAVAEGIASVIIGVDSALETGLKEGESIEQRGREIQKFIKDTAKEAGIANTVVEKFAKSVSEITLGRKQMEENEKIRNAGDQDALRKADPAVAAAAAAEEASKKAAEEAAKAAEKISEGYIKAAEAMKMTSDQAEILSTAIRGIHGSDISKALTSASQFQSKSIQNAIGTNPDAFRKQGWFTEEFIQKSIANLPKTETKADAATAVFRLADASDNAAEALQKMADKIFGFDLTEPSLNGGGGKLDTEGLFDGRDKTFENLIQKSQDQAKQLNDIWDRVDLENATKNIRNPFGSSGTFTLDNAETFSSTLDTISTTTSEVASESSRIEIQQKLSAASAAASSLNPQLAETLRLLLQINAANAAGGSGGGGGGGGGFGANDGRGSGSLGPSFGSTYGTSSFGGGGGSSSPSRGSLFQPPINYGGSGIPANAGSGYRAALGFASGGYTGDGPPNSIAGFAHRGEFYFDAQTTKRNRALFEAIQSGTYGGSRSSSGKSTSSGPSGQAKVTIHNYAGVQVETRQMSDGEILVMIDQKAREIAKKEAPMAVAAHIRNPNSSVSKSLNRSTNSGRRR